MRSLSEIFSPSCLPVADWSSVEAVFFMESFLGNVEDKDWLCLWGDNTLAAVLILLGGSSDRLGEGDLLLTR